MLPLTPALSPQAGRGGFGRMAYDLSFKLAVWRGRPFSPQAGRRLG